VADQVRLFIGVRVAVDVVHQLAELQKRMAGAARGAGLRVKWTAPAGLHVTLAFLGWARPEVVDAVADAGAHALRGARTFGFVTRGAGAFPSPARARVLWAGVDDGGRLSGLARSLGEATAALGFARETRPFHGHVTLGRLREPADVAALLAPHAEQIFSETWVESVVLFESLMKSKGSEYVARAEWTLEGPKRPPRRQTGPVEPLTDPSSEDPNGPAADQG